MAHLVLRCWLCQFFAEYWVVFDGREAFSPHSVESSLKTMPEQPIQNEHVLQKWTFPYILKLSSYRSYIFTYETSRVTLSPSGCFEPCTNEAKIQRFPNPSCFKPCRSERNPRGCQRRNTTRAWVSVPDTTKPFMVVLCLGSLPTAAAVQDFRSGKWKWEGDLWNRLFRFMKPSHSCGHGSG